MTYRPSIAERIAWTSGQLPNAEVKVLIALSSCGDYETGRNCLASLEDLVALSGVSSGTVKRALRRLKDPSQPGGVWVVATYRPRQRTRYDFCLDRLATRPPQEQQMTMAESAAAPPLGDQNDPDQIDPDQNDPPTSASSVRTYQDLKNVLRNDPKNTHTPRAREAESQLGDQNDPLTTRTLPLLGGVPPVKCLHHHAHAWCDGRVHVPRELHFSFLERLDRRPGEDRHAKAGRLIAFYEATLAAIPATDVIAEDDYKFWRRAFAAAFATPSPAAARERPPEGGRVHWREFDEAKLILSRAFGGRCPHEPRCESSTACVRAIALTRRSAAS